MKTNLLARLIEEMLTTSTPTKWQFLFHLCGGEKKLHVHKILSQVCQFIHQHTLITKQSGCCQDLVWD